MPKQYYEYDKSLSPEQNTVCALLSIANELHELNIFVAALGFADKTLPDGSIREMGAIENLAWEIKEGFKKVASRPDQP